MLDVDGITGCVGHESYGCGDVSDGVENERSCIAVFTVAFFFFSSRRRHTRFDCDWSSDVCSSDLLLLTPFVGALPLPAAALAAKVLNILLAALAAGLITWHASRAELLGPGVPAWLAAAVVVAAGVAPPIVTHLRLRPLPPLVRAPLVGPVTL